MILFPAIDLQRGRCVRLLRGDPNRATVFGEDPAAQAILFHDQGFDWIHVVDLDGAFAGRAENADAVRAILAAVNLPIQLGGGIRSLAAVEDWLDRGVARVVLGTAAVKNPALVREACARFPQRVAVGVDARDGRVAVEGWAESSTLTALDLAQRFEDAGAAAVVYTDVDRDGALSGLNVDATAELAARLRTPVIASGGAASLADLGALKAAASRIDADGAGGIAGVIAGRALYDGRLDPAAALELLAA